MCDDGAGINDSLWFPKLEQALFDYYASLVNVSISRNTTETSSFVRAPAGWLKEKAGKRPRNYTPYMTEGIFIQGIPLHQIAAQTLTAKEKDLLEQHGVRLKKEYFTAKEDEIIRKNWSQYCKISGTNEDDCGVYFGCLREGRRKKIPRLFRAWMCRNLFDRSAKQVYDRGHLLFHDFKDEGLNRPWSAEDQKYLLKEGANNPKWVEIGRHLKRTRMACMNEFKKLKRDGISEDSANKADEHNALVFYRTLHRLMGMDLVKAMLNQKLSTLQSKLDWNLLSELMNSTKSKMKNLYQKVTEKLDNVESESILHDWSKKRKMKKLIAALPSDCQEYAKSVNKPHVIRTLSPKTMSKVIKIMRKYHIETISRVPIPPSEVMKILSPAHFPDLNPEQCLLAKRRIQQLLSRLNTYALFDYLPREHATVSAKLKLATFVTKNLPTVTRYKPEDVWELANEYLRRKKWKPRRTIFVKVKN